MRIKLTKLQKRRRRAPAERGSSKAQGGRARDSVLWNPGFRDRLGDKPCKGGADGLCRPYRALPKSLQPQGFGRFAAFALGFAVPRFQRWRNLVSLTRMPFRAPVLFTSNPGFRPLRGLHPGLCCSAFRGPAPSALVPDIPWATSVAVRQPATCFVARECPQIFGFFSSGLK